MGKKLFLILVPIVLFAVFSFQLYITYLRYNYGNEQTVEQVVEEYTLNPGKNELIYNNIKAKYSELNKSGIKYYKIDSLESKIPLSNFIYLANDSVAEIKYQKFKLVTITKTVCLIGTVRNMVLDSSEIELGHIKKTIGDSLINEIKITALIKFLEKAEGQHFKYEYKSVKPLKKNLPYLDILPSAFGFLLSLLYILLNLNLNTHFYFFFNPFKKTPSPNIGDKTTSLPSSKESNSRQAVDENIQSNINNLETERANIEKKLTQQNDWNIQFSFETNITRFIEKLGKLNDELEEIRLKNITQNNQLEEKDKQVQQLLTEINKLKNNYSETDRFFEKLKVKYAEEFFNKNNGKNLSYEEFNKEVSPKIIEVGIIFMFFLKTYNVSPKLIDEKYRLQFMEWAKGNKSIPELLNNKDFEMFPDRSTGGLVSDFHFLLKKFMESNNVNTKQFPIERYITE